MTDAAAEQAEVLFSTALTYIESSEIRRWASCPRNRKIWLEVAREALAKRDINSALTDPKLFATYIYTRALEA